MTDNDSDAPFSPPDYVPFSNQIDHHDVNDDESQLWDHHDAASSGNHTAADDNLHHNHQHQHLQFIVGNSPDDEYPRSYHHESITPNHHNDDDNTNRGNQDADGLPTADENEDNENENNNDANDDDITVIPLPSSTQYAMYRNSTLSTLIPPPPPTTIMMNTITWLEQPTADMEQLRRRIIHLTLCRVERNAALTMACLCLVPVLLALVVVITAREFMGPASHCQDPSVLAMNVTCRRLPRQFLNAFASQCVCDGVAITIRQQYNRRREV